MLMSLSTRVRQSRKIGTEQRILRLGSGKLEICAFQKLTKLWNKLAMGKKAKVKLCKKLDRPLFFYGCEARKMTKGKEKK